ncbi:serine hydrolase [Candidatus Binatus sp.]|uniref:serine hydrolase domain-containing protein n=1 Tax=Candidatus Binatus sp. TaxID=2811406 RepID=UPI003CC65B48
MKPNSPTSAAIVALAMIIAGASGCARRPPPAPAPKPQTIDQLKAAIAGVLERTHTPGCGFALVSKDSVIFAGGVGKADLATNREVTGDTMFRIGSITKSFVALSLLQLNEQGKVDLHAKVADLAPEVKIVNRWDATDPIRIVNLLEHTAGFDDMSPAETFDMSGGPQVPLLETFARFPEPQIARWRPGTRQSYSNPDYAVAGYIIEKLTGKPCEDYIADNILRPLAMTHSDMRLTPEMRTALAQGYRGNPPIAVPYYPILLRPAGEMKSSPNEMARFVRMMLNRGTLDGVKIVSPESITRMETPETGLAARAGFKDGYALGNYVTIRHPIKTHGHNGGIDGFLSVYAYMPEQGLGYFLSINASSPALSQVEDLIFAYITRGVAIPPKPAAVPLDADVVAAAGFYQFASPRNEKFKFLEEILAEGWTYTDHGKLYRRGLIPAPPEELVYLGHNQFRTAKESGADGVYCTDHDGNRYGCGELACFRRISPVWPATQLILLVGAVLTMATSLGFALVWIPRKLLGRMQGVRYLAVRVVPLLASLTFLVTIILWIHGGDSTFALATPSPFAIAICLLTLLFAILSVLGFALAIRSFGYPMNRAARLHSIAVAFAALGWTVFLGYWGMIGLRFWAI